MKIIERILTIAKEKKIREVDIANAIGKGTSQITNWKMRGTTPPAEQLPAIADLLGVSIELLITGKEGKPGAALPKDKQQLLDYYDAANPEGKQGILDQAEFISGKHPSNLIDSGEKTG